MHVKKRACSAAGAGFAALIQKPMNAGNLNWFINSPSTSYWGDTGDYAILKTIIRNMVVDL